MHVYTAACGLVKACSNGAPMAEARRARVAVRGLCRYEFFFGSERTATEEEVRAVELQLSRLQVGRMLQTAHALPAGLCGLVLHRPCDRTR
jgi:hypothetical protein